MIADQPQAPDLSGIGWFFLWMPQIQQHTRAVPNPCSTMCLFSPLLKQRTQVFETTKGLVTEVWKNDISSMPGYTCAKTLNHSCVLYVQINCAYFHTEKGCLAFVSVCLKRLHCMGVCVCKCTVTISLNPAEPTALWWPQPQSTLWLKYHMEWHMPLGSGLTCLPARGKAVGQSHFQQINLIWKFSSPCNLKQQQQGPASPPILNSFLSLLFSFSSSALT